MALFRRREEPAIRAAAATSTAQLSSAGALTVTNNAAADRARAMRIPTISRARDLLCSSVASAEIRYYSQQWTGERLEEIPVTPEAWMTRPDSRTTLAHTLAWTTDSLLFHGFAAWYVTSRRQLDGRPASFTVLDPALLAIQASAWAHNVPIGDYRVTYNGTELARRDVIMFWSPIQGLLSAGAREILVAERLASAALRFASSPMAFGHLKQRSGEPLSGDDLAELATSWAEARDTNSIAALNEFVDWVESSMDPSRLQLIEARMHQATELARLANVSAFLVSAPTGAGNSVTYQNAAQATEQLWQDSHPYLECIEQTLSNEEITPRGRVVRLERHTESPTEIPAPTDAPQLPQGTPA